MQLLKIQTMLWQLIHIHIEGKVISRKLYLRVERLYSYVQRDMHKIHFVRVANAQKGSKKI